MYQILRTQRPRLRFGLLFALCLGLMALCFWQWQSVFARGFMYPVSAAAVWALNLIGVSVRLDASSLSLGFCLLTMEKVSFRVIFECTGLFALFILLAAIFAYPASLRQKGWGTLLGIAAFFLYGSARLVLLGVVGHLAPGWLPLFHLYLMVLLNLGFMVFLWLYWIGEVTRHA